MRRRELAPLLALAAIVTITAAWWAMALWPLPADVPRWLERTRLVCFGAGRESLPTAAGWTLLIGEPLAMLAALLLIWPRDLADALRVLVARAAGRWTAGLAGAAVLTGLAAAALRVTHARAGEPFDADAGGREPVTAALALEGPAPELRLVDQAGDTITTAGLRGRVVLVTFAYAHCATVCPLVVHEALAAQQRLAVRPVLVVVTLDPWRDTPSRLPAVARSWRLGADAHVLSGPVDQVQRVLDDWGVSRTRDDVTGEIAHGAFVLLVNRSGRLAHRVPGYADAIAQLAETL